MTVYTYTADIGDHPHLHNGAEVSCGDRVRYKIPHRFLEDHIDRACIMHTDVEVEVHPRFAYVWLRPCDARDLMSDAEYYGTTSPADLDPSLFGVISSARATVRALERQGVARVHGWRVA